MSAHIFIFSQCILPIYIRHPIYLSLVEKHNAEEGEKKTKNNLKIEKKTMK